MSDLCAYWLAVKALREEIKQTGYNEVYLMTTPAIRHAVDSQYKHLTQAVLDRIHDDWRYREQHGPK